jgi:imidazolonepropionase-like amidohydrolase
MKGMPEDLPRSQSYKNDRGRLTWPQYLGILFLVILSVFWLKYAINDNFTSSRLNLSGRNVISSTEFEYGRSRCLRDQQRPMVDYDLAARRIASLSDSEHSGRLIIKNATIIDGDGEVSPDTTIVVRGRIIEKTQKTDINDILPGDVVLDIQGRYLSPGLIEMHSHAGVRALPQLWASEDVTETSAPVSPWARAIDGYKSNDMAIDLVASGGVTTSLVLTGAQNIISGEGYVFKMRRDDSPYSMLVNTSRESGGKSQRYLKAALGENIKKTFQDRSGGPVTREGISYYFRHALEEARHLKRQQDDWCEALHSKTRLQTPYPDSIQTQTLIDLLRGDIRLNVHCYETEDVYSLFDHSDEFGFNISAVHHAMASHLMIDELKRREVAVATFSDEWGFKPEIYDTSFYLSKALVEAGVPLALTSDHPAGYGKLLTYQAQVAYHYGVDAEHAIASLISVPAKYLGLDNRIGYIRPGYDADLAVWNKHPLRLGATPLLVAIDGDVVINATDSFWRGDQPLDSSKASPQRTQRQNSPFTCSPGQKNLVIQGITSDFFSDDNSDMEEREPREANTTATAVIRDGELACVGKRRCRALAELLVSDEHVPVLNVTDGYVLPVRRENFLS